MLEQSTNAAAPVDRFMGRFVDFETVADASAATAGDAAGDAPSGTDPAAAPAGGAAGEAVSPPAAATEPVPAASPPALDLTDPQIAELVQGLVNQQLQPLLQYLQPDDDPAAGAQPGQQPFDPSQLELDPFGDDFGNNLAQLLVANQQQTLQAMQSLIGQVAQPLNARIEAETTAEGNQRLADILADDIARNGDFPRAPGETDSKAQQLVRPLAESLFPQLAERWGAGPRTAEMAMTQAASTIRGLIAEASAHAVAAYKNQLETLGGAATEPGAGGAVGVQGLEPVRARTIDEGLSAVTARHAAALRGA